ncbi:MAG TPA: histidine phosphatase family protein [Acidimicrobiales bacterium]|nr:histidine phosphatase family protein [Acidimicrobiales bacterium]
MILVRHAKPLVDPTIPPAEWDLADGAREAATELGSRLRGTRVLASTERKAIATAEALGLGPVRTSEAFCEVGRPWYDDGDAMARDAQRWFAGERVDGWEPFADAVHRFGSAVDGQSVVVTHGTVMTAWLLSRGVLTEPFAFWRDLRMPDAWELGPTLMRCP